MTEKEIITGVLRKERTAQILLYQKYRSYWYTICLRYVQNRPDANDILQNALIKIYSKIELYDSAKGSFKSWSAKVVVNENLQFLRKKSASFNVDPIEELLFIPENAASVYDILSAKELMKMIQKIPNGYRTVFNLYAIEGYSHKEIAEQLNISVGTSKSQLSKARKLLQKQLEALLQD